MGFLSGMIGGVVGFGCQIFSNAARKIPLSRQPWLHVTFFVMGYWIGDYYPKLERYLVDDINEIRAERGLRPLVGTIAWIKYQVPEEEGGEVGRPSRM